MRATILSIAVAGVLAGAATPAAAWDGPAMWYAPVGGPTSGGGGIFGTGGQRDHHITCLDCHVDPVDTGMSLDFQFDPPLAGADASIYTPGQRYRVDVRMLGASPSCGNPVNIDNFAATFEDDAGTTVGLLESDSGQSQGNCPTDYPNPSTGTTALFRDCQVIFSRGLENARMWRFYWTAPPAGTVRLYYGAVDGDCWMNSRDDAVDTGRRTLTAASAAAPGRSATGAPAPTGSPLGALIVLGLLVVAVGVAGLRRAR